MAGWDRPHTRDEAALPPPGIARRNYGPPVGRVDSVHGDRRRTPPNAQTLSGAGSPRTGGLHVDERPGGMGAPGALPHPEPNSPKSPRLANPGEIGGRAHGRGRKSPRKRHGLRHHREDQPQGLSVTAVEGRREWIEKFSEGSRNARRRFRRRHAAQAIPPQASATVVGSGTIACTRTIPSFVPW